MASPPRSRRPGRGRAGQTGHHDRLPRTTRTSGWRTSPATRALEWVRAATPRPLPSCRPAAGSPSCTAGSGRSSTPTTGSPTSAGTAHHLYNFWQDARHPRGLWRRTTLESYAKEQPEWEVLLDLDALARGRGRELGLAGRQLLRPGYGRCLVELSRGGADAAVVREFDLTAMAFVDDGFRLPEAKSIVGWIDADTVYVGTDFGPGSMTASRLSAHRSKQWRRGTPLADADAGVRGRGRRRLRLRRARPDARLRARLRRARRSTSTDASSSCAPATAAAPHRRARGRRRRRAPRVAAGARPRAPWTVGGHDLPGRLRCWPPTFDAFLAGEREFDGAVRAGRAHARCRTTPGPGTT